jgi:hypothetical protein
MNFCVDPMDMPNSSLSETISAMNDTVLVHSDEKVSIDFDGPASEFKLAADDGSAVDQFTVTSFLSVIDPPRIFRW